MGKDYYKILGIGKGATEDELKKAYYKMALIYNPDRNKDLNAEEKTKELTEAYNVLLDAKKKEIYDKYGEEGLNGRPGRSGSRMRNSSSRRDPQDSVIERELFISLEDIYKGCKKKKRITRKVISADGSIKEEDKILSINIKPGWKSGTKITFAKAGDQMPGRVPADISFVVRDKPHSKFKREGSDIRYVHRLTLRQALCGSTVYVPTLDGPTKKMAIESVIKPNSTRRLSGEGLPNPDLSNKRGDLIVEFNVVFPDSLEDVDFPVNENIVAAVKKLEEKVADIREDIQNLKSFI